MKPSGRADEISCYFRCMHSRSSAADATELATEPTSTGSCLAVNSRIQHSKILQLHAKPEPNDRILTISCQVTAVLPDWQQQGIGQLLIEEGLKQLRDHGAAGCLLVGDPNYYSRFGFTGDCGLTHGEIAASYIQALPFGSAPLIGEVRFAPAFYKIEK